jgi:RNA polymerase sigma-B factor
MGVTAEDVLEAMDAGGAYTSDSLDAPVGEEAGGATVGDLLADVDEHLENVHERVAVAAHLRELPERQRVMLYLRFFEA